MRIGVDELFQAKGYWWCHLLCDDFRPEGLEQLHEFAAQIGVPRRAFHNPSGPARPHYDLRPRFRDDALRHGALELTSEQVVEFLHRGRRSLSRGS